MDSSSLYKQLSEPFPKSAHQTRVTQGKKLTYVEGSTVIRRLNSTGAPWHFQIINQDMQPFGTTSKGEPRYLLRSHGRLTISDLGTRDATGVQVVNATSGGEDLWKGADTDSLKKCATLFGVALELYSPDYEAMAPQNAQNRPVSNNATPHTSPAPSAPQSGAQSPTEGNAESHRKAIAYFIMATNEAGVDDEGRAALLAANGYTRKRDVPEAKLRAWAKFAKEDPTRTLERVSAAVAEARKQQTMAQQDRAETDSQEEWVKEQEPK